MVRWGSTGVQRCSTAVSRAGPPGGIKGGFIRASKTPYAPQGGAADIDMSNALRAYRHRARGGAVWFCVVEVFVCGVLFV